MMEDNHQIVIVTTIAIVIVNLKVVDPRVVVLVIKSKLKSEAGQSIIVVR